jgi:hypothetical protein
MSRVFNKHSTYERECAERAALARAGKLDTHSIGQAGLIREWEIPENWMLPAKPDEEK